MEIPDKTAISDDLGIYKGKLSEEALLPRTISARY